MRPNKLILLTTIVLALVQTALFAQETRTLSLEEAQDFALENSTTIVNAKIEEQESEGVVREYKSIGLPQVSAGVNFQHFFDIPTQSFPDFISPAVYGVLFAEELLTPTEIEVGTFPAQFGTENVINANIEASQLLYSGTYNLGLKAIRKYLDRSVLSRIQKEIELKKSVADAYFTVLVTQENIDLLKSSQSTLDKLLSDTRALNQNGFVEEIEVDRLQLSSSNLLTQIEAIERQVNQAKDALKLLIGMDLGTGIELSDDLEGYIATNETLLAEEAMIANRIEDRLFDLQDEFDDLEIRKVKSEYYPTLTAFGSYGRSFQSNDFKIFDQEWFPTAVAGINLSIPIFDGFKKRGVMEQKKLIQLRNQNNRELFNKSFDLEVSTARANYVNAKSSLDNQAKNLELAEKIFRVTKIKYNEGFGSSLELTSAESQKNETRTLYVNALYELVLAINELKKSLGKF